MKIFDLFHGEVRSKRFFQGSSPNFVSNIELV